MMKNAPRLLVLATLTAVTVAVAPPSAPAEVICDDHFDNGDPATGGTLGGWTFDTMNGVGQLTEAGTIGTLANTGGGNYSNLAMDSVNTFDLTGIDQGLGFVATWTFSSYTNGIRLVLDLGGVELHLRSDEGGDYSFSADGTVLISEVPFTFNDITDGEPFTISLTANTAGFQVDTTGILSLEDDDISGNWGSKSYPDAFSSADAARIRIQKSTSNAQLDTDRFQVTAIPEPATFSLAALGLLGLLPCGRRARR